MAAPLRKREMTEDFLFPATVAFAHENARREGRAKVDAAGRRRCAARSVNRDYSFSE
jgi:hypothetical protein